MSHLSRLEAVIAMHCENMKLHLDSFNINDVQVTSQIEQRSAKSFDDDLTLGFCYVDHDDLPFLLASSEVSPYNHKGKYQKLRFLAVPSLLEDNIYTNKNTDLIAVKTFFIYEDGKIIPVQTDEPLQLDGVKGLNHLLKQRKKDPRSLLKTGKIKFGKYFITDERTQEIVDNKEMQNRIIKAAGIKVARQIEMIDEYKTAIGKQQGLEIINSENSVSHEVILSMKIAQYISQHNLKDFVIKSVDGCQGSEVKLFTADETHLAAQFCKQLFVAKKRVVLEERIHPVEWIDEEGKNLDWNLRAFITTEKNPQFIDAVVRYNIKNGNPVNLCKGAEAIHYQELFLKLGIGEQEMKQTAEEISKAFYHAVGSAQNGKARGFLGLDLIIAEDGIYMIEANGSSSSGFGSLGRTTRKKSDAIARYFFPSFRGFLEQNHQRRKIKNQKSINDDLTNQSIANQYIALETRDEDLNTLLEKIVGKTSKRTQCKQLLPIFEQVVQERIAEYKQKITPDFLLQKDNAAIVHNQLSQYDLQLFSIAFEYARINKTDEAIRIIKQKIKQSRELDTYYLELLAARACEAKKYGVAIKHLEKVLKTSIDPHPYSFKAMIEVLTEKYTEARKTLLEGIKKYPIINDQSVLLHINLAIVYLKATEYDLAEQTLKQLEPHFASSLKRGRDKNNIEALDILSEVYFYRDHDGDHKKAKDLCARVMDLCTATQSTNSYVLLRLARIYHAEDDLDKAEVFYRYAQETAAVLNKIKGGEKDSQLERYAHLGLAEIYFDKHKWYKTTVEARKAINLGLNIPQIYDLLGSAQHYYGKTEKALVSLQQALAVDPNYLEAHRMTLQIYLEKGFNVEFEIRKFFVEQKFLDYRLEIILPDEINKQETVRVDLVKQ